MRELIERKGSDLHIIAGLRPAIRIDGKLTPLENYEVLSAKRSKELIFSILSGSQKMLFESDKDNKYELDFGYGIENMGRFRFNVYMQKGTVAAAIRALGDKIPNIEDLGLPESIRDFAKEKRGLILVTGPTGSGKSTTLAALIGLINQTRMDHIITIEDPIEFIHKSDKSYVTQREVGLDTLSYKKALKYALRQDPDVILIGEMRDYETIGIALTAAETGHLVLGTLHTSGATQTIGRIIDVFPPSQQAQIQTQLALNLVGIISQILLPRIDRTGRCMACEIVKVNPAIRNNIRTNKAEAIYQTIQTSKAEGMITMDNALINLYKEGIIDFETAQPYIHNKSTYETMKSNKMMGNF